jgi:hypothetical protein
MAWRWHRSVVEYGIRHDVLHGVGAPCDPEPDVEHEADPLTEDELQFIDWLADEALKEWLAS